MDGRKNWLVEISNQKDVWEESAIVVAYEKLMPALETTEERLFTHGGNVISSNDVF